LSSDPPAILAENLTKRFGERTAVDRLSLTVKKGEIYGLVGPDGAGKTTTLRMLSSIMDPSDGHARIAGYDVGSDAAAVKEHMAYMSQRFALYPDLTVAENAAFYADLYGVPRKGRGRKIDELLDFSQMGPFKKRRAGNLSGGMKQKLQLVCALIHTPAVLLLDEPTNGVDPVSRRDFWRILYHLLSGGVAILVTTAYLDEAERCHRVGLLDRGRLLDEGTPEAIRGRMQGSLLSVRTSDPRRARRVLRSGLAENISVHLFGDAVHAVTDDPEREGGNIRRLLEDEGIGVEEIREEPPSLEDVFVSVMGKGKIPADAEPGTGSGRADAALGKTDGKAVTVSGLTRRFGDFTAVDDVRFSVPRGQIFGFLGPNGAGKSTTIRMMCGLLAPTSGSGTVAGYDILTQPERIKESIGYMSQKFSLYDDLTVEENIDFYGGIYGLQGRSLRNRKEWAVAMAGLSERRRDLTLQLSGGWKQRLAFACAVLHEPPIVFLDEPTSGVDPLSRRRFWDRIYEMAASGTTVFVTTHYMEEAEYCDRIAMIYRGRVIALGTPRELKTTSMEGEVLDVRCPRPQEVVDALAALEGVRDAALFGAGVHLSVADAAGAKSAVERELDRLGVSVRDVEAILPSMEDVFVSLVEAEDRKSGGSG
jgi:ABC-2 type transport system ATP-binding protein